MEAKGGRLDKSRKYIDPRDKEGRNGMREHNRFTKVWEETKIKKNDRR